MQEASRSTFSNTEVSLQSFFELLSFSSTIAFAKPDQFRYPAAVSVGALLTASVCYTVFVRQRRGHLLHGSNCMGFLKSRPYERVAETDDLELAE